MSEYWGPVCLFLIFSQTLMSVKCFIMGRQVVCVCIRVLTPPVAIAVHAQLATTWAETAEAAEVSHPKHAIIFICYVKRKVMRLNLVASYAYTHFLLILHIDIDECATRQNNCTRDQLCINTYGGFQCVKVDCPRIRNVTYVKTSPT